MQEYPPLKLTPEQFELEAKSILDGLATGLVDYKSEHREIVAGPDGEYEIDISTRFTALGVNFLTLVECKRYKSPVEREKVQVLHSKMLSVSAQKGIMFSTSGFQSGAVEFAVAHGIALVHLQDGRTMYIAKALGTSSGAIPWDQVPEYIPKIAGWLYLADSISSVSKDNADALAKTLGLRAGT